MSWHARWGRKDPFAKPAKVGDTFGIFTVIDTAPLPDPHYGIRAKVRCQRCGFERVSVLAQMRHRKPVTHRGCAGLGEDRVKPSVKNSAKDSAR